MAFHWKRKNTDSEKLQHPDRTSDNHILSSILVSCSEFYSRFLGPLFHFIYRVCRLTIRGVVRRLRRFYRFMKRIFLPKWNEFICSFREWGEEFLRCIKGPLFKIRRGWYLVERNYLWEAEEKGFWDGLVLSYRTFKEGVVNNKRLLRQMFNYVLPVAMITVLITVVVSSQNLTFAVEVNYNGQSIGYIADEKVFEEAEQMMQQRIVYENNEDAIAIIPKYSLTLVNKSDILNQFQLADNMVRLSNLDITEAEGVYVGDQFYGAVKDSTQIQEALDQILQVYRSDAANETVEFEKKIDFRKGLYLVSSVVEEQSLINTFTSQKQAQRNYIVKKGDTPYDIAQDNNISLSELISLNPTITTSFYPGDTVILSQSVPFLSVKVSRTENYEEAIPYNTVEVQDAKYLKGTKVETQKGQTGIRQVTAKVEYVNGIEVNRTVLNSQVVKEPVERRVTVGTAQPVKVAPSASIQGNGMFINPCPSGYVSQEFGHAGHKGMDIASGYGNTIYASAGGTVILARWYSGYGKCVMIDHGNGIVTLYGHASSLYVSVGQVVGQGAPIAAVGSTGWSTGNHCHFEIRVNGQFINPRRYL
jgi:murein DD-endopeptidase MepM/ murein hydrolase activator NlpD